MTGTLVGSYSIVREIDSGSMGTVYLAEHVTLKDGSGVPLKAAIKILHPHLTKSARLRERFLQEAQTQFNLHHEGITRVIDYSEDQNRMYIVMEYLQGITLDRYIGEIRGLIPEQEARELFIRILDAVEHAHQRNIVHRDLKPANIMVMPDGKIRIMDFGIARILDGDMSMTRTGTRLGSPMYMSPEQAQAREADFRSDIYTLGVVLFEMVTGKPVYDKFALNENEIYKKIIYEPLPRARDYYELISDHYQAIIDKATAKNPAKRFQSIAEFRDALSHRAGNPPKSVNLLPVWVTLGVAGVSGLLFLFLININRPGKTDAGTPEIKKEVPALSPRKKPLVKNNPHTETPDVIKPVSEIPAGTPMVNQPAMKDSHAEESESMVSFPYVDKFSDGTLFSDKSDSYGTYHNYSGFARISSTSSRNRFVRAFTFSQNAGREFVLETEIRFNTGTQALNNGNCAAGIMLGSTELTFMMWYNGNMALTRLDGNTQTTGMPGRNDLYLPDFESGRKYRFRFSFAGDILSVYIDDRKYLSARPETIQESTFGFVAQQGASADILSFSIQ